MPNTHTEETVGELLGLEVERVDFVTAPAIRRKFFLTKAQDNGATHAHETNTDVDDTKNGKEADQMPNVLEDMGDVVSRMKQEDGEAELGALRAEAKTIVERLRLSLEQDDEALDRAEIGKALLALEAAISGDGATATAEELALSIQSVKALLDDNSEAVAGTSEAKDNTEGVTDAVADTASADEASDLEPAGESDSSDNLADSGTEKSDADDPAVATVLEEGATQESVSVADGDSSGDATDAATAAEEAATEESNEPDEPAGVAKADALSTEEEETLLRALQAVTPFKSKLPTAAWNSFAKLVGYQASKAFELPDTADVEAFIAKSSDLPDPVRAALAGYVTLAKQAEFLRSELATAHTEIDDTKTQLTKSQEAELVRVCKSEAQSVRQVGIGDEELTSLLIEAKKYDPAFAAKLLTILKTANEQIKKSGLFDIFGSAAAAPDSARGKIEAIAVAKVAKNAGMSLAVARGEAWKEHPELFNEYQNDRP